MTKIRYPLAHHSASKNERLVIAITRYSVETGDTRPLLDKLLPLAPSREAPLHWAGKLTFYLAMCALSVGQPARIAKHLFCQ